MSISVLPDISILSHTRMGRPMHTHMGYPVRVWDNSVSIRVWASNLSYTLLAMAWIACPCTWPWPTLHACIDYKAGLACVAIWDRTEAQTEPICVWDSYIASYNSTIIQSCMAMHLSRLAIGSSIYAITA